MRQKGQSASGGMVGGRVDAEENDGMTALGIGC